MSRPFEPLATRRAHLAADNPLRSLTEVINRYDDGINLGQGVCDLDSPEPLRRGVRDAIDHDRQMYTHYAGLPELRAAIAGKLQRFNGLDYAPEQVAVTAGSSGALFAVGATLFDPGAEVVLFEPFYSYHWSQIRLLGAKPVAVRMPFNESFGRYQLDLDALRAALTPKTRAIVINTPVNPCGKVFTVAELDAIGAVLDGSDIAVLTDEVYEYMCFAGHAHVSPATRPSLAARTLTLGGFSKTYSITGWRIGYVAGPEDIIEAIGRVFDQSNVCAARPMQRGVLAALNELPDSFYSDLRLDYERRRDQFCDALTAGGFGVRRPEGAYYVMADYRPVLGDVEPMEAVRELIQRVHINAVPGHLFYAQPAGVREMRFHFAARDDALNAAGERIRHMAERSS